MMESKKVFYVEEQKCMIKQKFGKCLIPFRLARFCMDCFTIHMEDRCPNCLSHNSVRLIELFLSDTDPSDEKIKKVIEKKFLEI